MKKILSYMLAYLPMMLLLVGCSEAEKIDDSPSKKVTVIAQMPESGTTRAELSVSENSLNLLAKWQANDKLKIILILNTLLMV